MNLPKVLQHNEAFLLPIVLNHLVPLMPVSIRGLRGCFLTLRLQVIHGSLGALDYERSFKFSQGSLHGEEQSPDCTFCVDLIRDGMHGHSNLIPGLGNFQCVEGLPRKPVKFPDNDMLDPVSFGHPHDGLEARANLDGLSGDRIPVDAGQFNFMQLAILFDLFDLHFQADAILCLIISGNSDVSYGFHDFPFSIS